MKALRLAAIALLIAGCASSGGRADAPKVAVSLQPINGSNDVFFFHGPISLQYQLGLSNPSDEPLTLRRIELHTEGSGAYRLNTSAPTNLTVPAKSNVAYKISVWGTALGGYMRMDEPVTMRITAYFDSPRGGFVRQSTEMIQPST